MKKKPVVSVIMGSDSDLPVMSEALTVLKKFGLGYEVKVLSAHRTPDKAATFAKGAKKKGIKVIIAGAGGAAHLAGVTAAHTTLPVIDKIVLRNCNLNVLSTEQSSGRGSLCQGTSIKIQFDVIDFYVFTLKSIPYN